jgi:hypothetical protein
MSLLASFQSMAGTLVTSPPSLLGFIEADHVELDRDRNRGRGRIVAEKTDALPVRPIAFAASDDEIAERRAVMVALHRGWLQDEQRDAMTGTFIPSV